MLSGALRQLLTSESQLLKGLRRPVKCIISVAFPPGSFGRPFAVFVNPIRSLSLLLLRVVAGALYCNNLLLSILGNAPSFLRRRFGPSYTPCPGYSENPQSTPPARRHFGSRSGRKLPGPSPMSALGNVRALRARLRCAPEIIFGREMIRFVRPPDGHSYGLRFPPYRHFTRFASSQLPRNLPHRNSSLKTYPVRVTSSLGHIAEGFGCFRRARFCPRCPFANERINIVQFAW